MILLLAAAAAVLLARWWRRRRHLARAAAELRRTFPELLELFVVLVNVGLTPPLALVELAQAAPPAWQPAVADAASRQRSGERFADALLALTERHGDVAETFVGVLAHADRYGEPVAPVLDRLAAEARQARRRQAEADARRIPVRLCFPLATCVLPAFVVLTIVPLLAGTFSSITAVAP